MVTRIVLIIFVLVLTGAAASEPPEPERQRIVYAPAAVELIRELRPDWYLSPNPYGKCGGSLYTRDGGRYPGGVALGGYTFLTAPLPDQERQSRVRRLRWNVCLIDSLSNVRWETEVEGLRRYDIAMTGTVAIAERIAVHVVGVKVISSSGRTLLSDVWLSAPPIEAPRGMRLGGLEVLKFSPTGRWLVMASAPADSLGDHSGEIVRVFDCHSKEVWAIRLQDCIRVGAWFLGPDTVTFACDEYSEDGAWRISRPDGNPETRTLNLEDRVLE